MTPSGTPSSHSKISRPIVISISWPLALLTVDCRRGSRDLMVISLDRLTSHTGRKCALTSRSLVAMLPLTCTASSNGAVSLELEAPA